MGITVELLLKSCICIGSISCLLWLIEFWTLKCTFVMGGIRKEKGKSQSSFLMPISNIIKVLSQNNINHLKSKIISLGVISFCCFLISFLPFVVLPLCEPIKWDGRLFYVEYLYSSIGGLFVPLISVFGPIILYSLVNKKITFSSEIALIRNLVHFFSAKGASLLILLSPFLVYNSLDFHSIVQNQEHYLIGHLPAYGLFIQPIAGILFFICIQTEVNIGSFNLFSSRGDISIRYYNNLTGIKVILLKFFEKAQWLSLVIFYVFIFLGGYSPILGLGNIVKTFPWTLHLVQAFSLLLKIMLVVSLSTWIKGLLPNYRTVDIVNLIFKRIILVAFINFLITVGYMYYR